MTAAIYDERKLIRPTDLEFGLCKPTKKELRYQDREGWHFIGDDLGLQYSFRGRVDSETALRRLKRHFGQPNRIRTDTRVSKKAVAPGWEYFLLAKPASWFVVYYKGKTLRIDYRFLVDEEVEHLRRTNLLSEPWAEYVCIERRVSRICRTRREIFGLRCG